MSAKIAICVGHGRSATGVYDPGAVSKDRIYHEHQIAKDIARYASEYLQCDLINYDGKRCLSKRIQDVNKGGYDFCADIHLNAGGGTGTETYYYHESPTGRKAAESICREIEKALNVKNRGAKVKLNSSGRDYFGFIRQTKPCAVLVETVFIDNDTDLEKIVSESGKIKCGEAIGVALEKLFAKNKKYKIICDELNIRSGAGIGYLINGRLGRNASVTITITSPDGKWGKLADGRGWINLSSRYVAED